MPRRSPLATPTAESGLFVGIDQSLTAFAAVAVRGHGDPEPNVLLIKPRVQGPRRLWQLRDGLVEWLTKLQVETPIDHIVMEGYAFSSQMGHAMGECGGMTKLALLDTFGLDVLLAYPTIPTTQQLKMFCGLPGNAKKNLMLKAVYKKWGLDFNDDNLADAYGLAQIACSLKLGARFEYESAVLAKITAKTGVHTEWESPSTSAKKKSSG